MSFVAPVTNHSSTVHRIRWIATTLTALVWLALPVAAQEDPNDPFAGIEEMVVVGTGAGALLQAQEVSAINFDADYLEALGASDLSDISQFTPNLEIRTPFAASNPTLFIRGVGLRDFNANSSSSVAVYNDEIYMNSPAGQLAQLFDVENIDVLRGPQATIYGRNASAGTIRVLARKPTGSPGATVKATYGRFNQAEVEGAVENVLVPDLISMRTAARMNRRDGITRNRCADDGFNLGGNGLPPGTFINNRALRVFRQCYNRNITAPPESDGLGLPNDRPLPYNDWVNEVDNWGARTLIRAQFSTGDVEHDWILNFHGGQNRGDARQFQMVGATQLPREIEPRTDIPSDDDGYIDADNQRRIPGRATFREITSPFDGNPYEGDYNFVDKEKLDLFGTSLVGKLDIGDFTLTTATGYEWNERDVGLNLDGSPFRSLEPILTNEAYQVTQELRLDYDAGTGLQGQLGGMFLYEGLSVDNTFILNRNLAGTVQTYTFFTRYFAAWANAAWEPAETFKVEVGGRVNYEDKELNLQSNRFNVRTGEPAVNSFATANAAAKEVGWAGDVKGTYSPVEDVSFYIRYARGWKGPHINGGVVNPASQGATDDNLTEPVEPEKIDSIELGMKGRFWDARITANWALFYYDYQDLQVFQLANNGGQVPVQQLLNAGDADVLGFEGEFDIKPFEGWGPAILDQLWIHTTFAWLESKYTDFVNKNEVLVQSGASVSLITTTEDFSGNRLVNSPEFSFIGFVAWPLGGDWGTVIPRLDWSFKDEVFFNQANSDLIKQDPLWLLNFRLTYKAPSGNFEVAGWVENLTDQAYTVDVFNLARLRRAILHAVGDPRTYGVTMTVNF